MGSRVLTEAMAVVLVACSGSSPSSTAGPTSSSTAPAPTPSPTPPKTTTTTASERAEVVYTNGLILTMDLEQPRAEAVAVAGDQIIAVGTEAEIMAEAGDRTIVVDLQRHTLMPGFVDAHNHLFDDAASLGTDLMGAQTLALENGITTLGNMFATETFLAEIRAPRRRR